MIKKVLLSVLVAVGSFIIGFLLFPYVFYLVVTMGVGIMAVSSIIIIILLIGIIISLIKDLIEKRGD